MPDRHLCGVRDPGPAAGSGSLRSQTHTGRGGPVRKGRRGQRRSSGADWTGVDVTGSNMTGVGVWGTGNMGRAAIAAIVGHPELDLRAVLTSSAERSGLPLSEVVTDGSLEGRHAAEASTLRLTQGTDPAPLVDSGCAAVVYAASGDIRPDEALADICACLAAGLDVVSPSLYALYDPDSAPEEVRRAVLEACREGGASLFVSGVDPGWGNDLLPLLATGLCHDITSVRSLEVFDYSTYDQEFSVRELVGMGGPMDRVPPMVAPGVPTMVWGGQVRLVARELGIRLDGITETLERLPLDQDVETALGTFEAGTQGALRFEVVGHRGGVPAVVVEHVTRIHPEVAPDWPQPTTGAGSHRVVVEGVPRLEITVEAETEGSNRAAGGNATAAMRLVGAIPWLAGAEPGMYDGTRVPLEPGRDRFVEPGR